MVLRRADDREVRAWKTWRDGQWPRPALRLVTESDVDRLFSEMPGPQRMIFRAEVRDLQGAFVANDIEATWDLTDPALGRKLSARALTVDPHDVKALAAFLGEWGRLGVGLGPTASGDTLAALHQLEARRSTTLGSGPESVAAIRAALTTYREHVAWLERLKAPRRRTPKEEWERFADAVEAQVWAVHPTCRWDEEDGQMMPAWAVDTPIDLLWMRLWDLFTGGGPLRRCRRCRDLFPGDRRGKRYCTTACTNRASAATSYRRKKRVAARELRLAKQGRPPVNTRRPGRSAGKGSRTRAGVTPAEG